MKLLRSPNKNRVCEMLRYDHRTGRLFWSDSHPRWWWRGREAGKVCSGGYRQIRIDGTPHMAHRLVWLIVHGSWPKQLIDHVNGNGTDNRACNLRLASFSENNRNTRKYRNNTSGVKGVSFHRVWNKWQAHIQVHGKQRFLGSYKTKEDAAKAYRKASKEYHGDFGRAA